MHFDGHWLAGEEIAVVHCYRVAVRRLKCAYKVTVTFQAHRLQSVALCPCLHQSCCNYKSTDNSQSYHKFSKFFHYLILYIPRQTFKQSSNDTRLPYDYSFFIFGIRQNVYILLYLIAILDLHMYLLFSLCRADHAYIIPLKQFFVNM
ncbi:hypothetical protein CB457P1_00098 [Enterocloster phage CB457P1]|nr:hypothetical protein CB457P1_00098 [Enterocloster phage CB457P1]